MNQHATRRSRCIVLTALVAAITFIVFARLIRCDFTWRDDQETISLNPRLNPPTWSTVAHYWSATGDQAPMSIYIPLTYSYWAAVSLIARRPFAGAYGIWLNPHIFHASNVLLHALCAAVTFRLFRLLIKNNGAVFFGALVFALHPIQVEPVAWASGAKDLLCGLFSIIALWQYVRSVQTGKATAYWLATICFVLAMFSKPAAIIVPLLAGVIDFGLFDRSWRRVIRSLLPWAILMVPCAIMTWTTQPAGFVSSLPIWTRPLIAADALAFYLWKLIWPLKLGVDYGRSPQFVWDHHWLFYTWIVPIILGILLVTHWKRLRPLTIAGILFVVGLLPVLGLAPFQYQYHSTVADHYLYLPMLGIGLAVGWLFSICKGTGWRIAACIVLLCWVGKDQLLESVWQNSNTLAQNAVRVSPYSFGSWEMLGYSHIADAMQMRARNLPTAKGEFEQAIVAYKRSLELNPSFIPAKKTLAVAYRQLGRDDEALCQIHEIVELQPILPPYLREDTISLAVGLDLYGDTPAAIELLNHSIAAHPRDIHALELREEMMKKAIRPSDQK